MFYLRALLAALWFLASSAVGLVMALVRWGDPSNGYRFGRLCSWGTLRLLRMQVQVEGADRLYSAQPCIYVANHQHNMDLFTFGSMYPPRTVVIGKKEIMRIPVFGLMFKAMGNILLDRERHHSAVSEMARAAQRIQEERISVWVFPEGHRNRLRGGLLPFKKGGFHLAAEAGVAVVPIVCADLRPVMRRGGVVRMQVLEPIPTSAETDIAALVEQTRERMTEALQRVNVIQ